MTCLFLLFHFSAFWAAHCTFWSVKPLAFSVLSFWRAGGGRVAQKPQSYVCSMGAAVFCTSHSRSGSWVCSLLLCGEQKQGPSPCYGAESRIGILGVQAPQGRDEPNSHPQIPRAGCGRAMRDPHSGGSGAHTDVGEGQTGPY